MTFALRIFFKIKQKMLHLFMFKSSLDAEKKAKHGETMLEIHISKTRQKVFVKIKKKT